MVATSNDQHRCTPMLQCLACGSSHLVTYLDLGSQPLANDYHDGTVDLASFPLAINKCESCYHSQLSHAVDPDLLFSDYSYVSGTTSTLSDYFNGFVASVESQFDYAKLSVLDIAGNDGTLLAKFASHGHDVLNVDPAANLTTTSESNGVPTMCDYWGRDTWQSLDHPYDAIVAMNVLGHVSNPLEFLEGCGNALARGGRIYIQTSQCEMVERGEFDTIYAEHHSFFTARSFIRLAQRAGLIAQSVQKVDVHGTSYLWTLMLNENVSGSVWKLLEYEVLHGYYCDATYRDFADKAERTANFLFQAVDEYRDHGYTPVGYGAAAKGMTVLNYADVELDSIIDDNPLKVGLLTPGRDIPIVPTEHLSTVNDPLCIVVPAWNFYSEICDRVARVRQRSDDVFIRYFPDHLIEAAWQQ